MGVAFDYCPDRPENIDAILNGLDRYNPETTTIFQEYVAQQCETQTYDCYANLALLKLYQFNPHLSHPETITNILTKSLTIFPSPDFSLGLALLPPAVLSAAQDPSKQQLPSSTTGLSEAVATLLALHRALTNARYTDFWASLEEDGTADLVADVQGFEEILRVRIAVVVSQCMQQVSREVLESWLNVSGSKFDGFVTEVCGWKVDGEKVRIPLNGENEARSSVVRESVKFEQFGRMVKRAYEQPA